MFRRALVVAGVIVGLSGCNSAARSECAARVEAMRTLFAHGPGEPVFVDTSGLQLPVAAGGAVLEDGIPMTVEAGGGFRFDNQVFATVAEVMVPLTEEYDKARQLGENLGKPWQPRLMVVADQRAPASAILELAAALPSATRIVVVAELAGDVPPTPPPQPAAVAEALKVPADQRSYALAELITKAIGGCEPLRGAFAAVADTTADQRSQVLLAGLPGALEQCGCDGVDVETLISAVWSMAGKTEPAQRQHALALVQDPAAEQVALAATASAADLVRLAVTRAGKPFRVAPGP